MIDENKLEQFSSKSLTNRELANLDQKVKLELSKVLCKAIKIGCTTNIISGFFVILALRSHEKLSLLIAWYGAITLFSLMGIFWARLFENRTMTSDQLIRWRKIFDVIVFMLCLSWGLLGVLFGSDLNSQIYCIAFLLAVLLGFTYGSVTDFTVSFISIICILLPTISYYIYFGLLSYLTTGSDPHLYLGLGIGLMILGTFMMVACHTGNGWVKRFFKLSFENVALNEKLGSMNKILELRVKERTVELENSLKLVSYQATHDLLTDLPNQRLLSEYMRTAMAVADEKNQLVGVIFFNLNEIEKINDGLGHQTGDLVIKKIARRLKDAFNAPEIQQKSRVHYTITLSRKDVFIILIEAISNIVELEHASDKLFSILEEPVKIDHQTIKLTASIGISVYPNNGKDAKSLLMNADAAMLRAKQRGGNNINLYKSEINSDISRQLEMESLLHSALKNNEFILQYQPFVDLKTGHICGAETLVRWKNPKLGFISPVDFIPLCEANGLIIPLGEWVLNKSCFQTKIWCDQNKSFKMAINLSAKQLHYKHILESVIKIISDAKLKPECIELELTESTAFQEDVIPIIKKFKNFGVGLSIDDFGTGFSGLTNLKLFEIDKLKIDKSFITDMFNSNDNLAIVLNIIDLAKKLNITVLAEGVETVDQVRFLQEHECDLIQGYYFSPPVDADTFSNFLRNKKSLDINTRIVS